MTEFFKIREEHSRQAQAKMLKTRNRFKNFGHALMAFLGEIEKLEGRSAKVGRALNALDDDHTFRTQGEMPLSFKCKGVTILPWPAYNRNLGQY